MALSIPHTEFMAFMANAKRQTYAAQGDDATVIPSCRVRVSSIISKVACATVTFTSGVRISWGERVCMEASRRYGPWAMPVGSYRRAAPCATRGACTSFCERRYAACQWNDRIVDQVSGVKVQPCAATGRPPGRRAAAPSCSDSIPSGHLLDYIPAFQLEFRENSVRRFMITGGRGARPCRDASKARHVW